jgi:primosomal replication protein N
MSQFPQNGYGAAPAAPTYGSPPAAYAPPGYAPQQAPAAPQQQQFAPPGPVSFPYENRVTLVGQICPTQSMQQGMAWKQFPNGGGQLVVNLKVRKETNYQGNRRVTITHVKVSLNKQQADSYRNTLAVGQFVRVVGELSISTFPGKDRNTGQPNGHWEKNVSIALARDNNGQAPLQVIGQGPVDSNEKSTPKNNGFQAPQQQQQFPGVPMQQAGPPAPAAVQYGPPGVPPAQYAPPQQMAQQPAPQAGYPAPAYQQTPAGAPPFPPPGGQGQQQFGQAGPQQQYAQPQGAPSFNQADIPF